MPIVISSTTEAMYYQNRRVSNLVNFTILVVFSTILSCQKKEVIPDCGCNAVKFQRVENVRASYNGGGGFNLFKKGTSSDGYIGACVIDTNWTISADRKLPDYTISGNIRTSCLTGETYLIIASPIEITAIKRD